MSRDPWLDNVKMTLVTLVVVGHSMALTTQAPLDLRLYDAIYMWHMPAFVVITGFLSRSFRYDRAHLVGVLTSLLIPYLVFEWALWHWRAHLGAEEPGPLWLQPHWGMWFLLVLAVWRLATPILKSHWLWVPASIGLSLVGGMVDSELLGVQRILGMLPFFVVGLHLDRSMLDRLDHRWVRVAGAGVLLWYLTLADGVDQWARSAFFYYDSAYPTLGYTWAAGMEVRLQVLALGMLGTAAALSLIPRRGGWFSRMGSASLVVYLCHGFVVRYAEVEGWFTPLADRPLLMLVAVVASATGLSLFLAWPPVAHTLFWVVDPVGAWRKRRLPWPGGARPLAGQREDDAGDGRRHGAHAPALSGQK